MRKLTEAEFEEWKIRYFKQYKHDEYASILVGMGLALVVFIFICVIVMFG